MADKEATVYIVDLSKSMSKKHNGREENDLEWALLYVWDKVTATVNTGRKTATLGVIGLGTDETILNSRELEGDESYEHISVLQPISQILMSHIRELQNQMKPSLTDKGDAVSAVVLAVDMIEKHCKQNQWIRKIILVTDGKGYIDPDLGDIPNKLKRDKIELSVLGVDFDDSEYGVKEEDKPERKAENENLLRTLTEECGGNFGTMQEAIDWLSVPRIKAVRPVTTYKGQLLLGDPENDETLLSIDIERYPKTMIAKPPTASSFVLKQDGSSQVEGMEVVRNLRTYTVEHKDHPSASAEGKLDVNRDELARGYLYGKTAVHIAESDENITKMETEQGYQIIGFVPLENVERYMILDTSNQIVAQRTNDKAILALSSFIRALNENETCAVARVVKKDMTDPLLTLLSPLIEPDGYECLIENFLPFAEDLRSYRFPPLDKVLTVSGKSLASHRNLPSDELQAAMDRFVDSMDLTDVEGDEYARMDDTFSPVLHRIEDAKKWRAVHPGSTVPQVPEVLLKYSKPPPGHINDSTLQILIKAADVKKVPPKVKGRRRFRDVEKPLSGLDVESLFRHEKRGKRIDPANAVPEFKQMLDLAEDEAVIPDAVRQMTAIVEAQIKNSFGDSKYNQALEGIHTMRQAMVEMEEPKLYNDMLRELKRKLIAGELGGKRMEMWYLIRSRRVGLIDKKLSPVSDVTPEQADEFMKKTS
jgi:ATP-dependent DNA helicase 2 subunit 2